MLVYISGQLVKDNSGAFDTPFKQWVEDGAQYLLGVPKNVWHAGDIKNADGTGMGDEIAHNLTVMFGHFCEKVGIFLLKIAPEVLLVVCLASILGFMIGSERCKHYASVSALAAIITQVVSRVVGA